MHGGYAGDTAHAKIVWPTYEEVSGSNVAVHDLILFQCANTQHSLVGHVQQLRHRHVLGVIRQPGIKGP